jgi:hypothetical protein
LTPTLEDVQHKFQILQIEEVQLVLVEDPSDMGKPEHTDNTKKRKRDRRDKRDRNGKPRSVPMIVAIDFIYTSSWCVIISSRN